MVRKLSDHPLHREPVDPNPDRLPYYALEEIPKWMRDNPFILNSYRAGYSFRMCLRSLFAIHNETMNVWTHLVGVLFFSVWAVLMFWHVLSPVFSHYLIFALMSLGCVMCLGCSTVFHLFSAHYSERICRRLHMLDYFGITCLVVGSFIPACYLSFACEPTIRNFYLMMISVLGAFGLAGPFYSFWTAPKFVVKKMLFYTVFVGSGVFPIVHVNFIMPPSTSAPFAMGLALEILLYLIGMLIYIFKVPERWFPGRFDIWFHSHQIWHVFVLMAALTHFFTIAGMYLQWETMEYHC